MGNFFSILLIIVLVCSQKSYGQQSPVYNHFNSNPYFYNPAEAGSNEFTSVIFNHRQQWRAFDGAPVASTLSFQTPFDYRKFAIGVNIRNYERGLLTTTDALLTYSYTIYLTKESTLHFGLSGGLTTNNIDINEVDDPSDPAIIELQNDNIQTLANFGVKFRSKSGINLGVALPKLLNPEFANPKSFETPAFSPFDEVTVMAYFKRPLEKKIVTKKQKGVRRRVAVENAYAPLQLYALYNYSKLVDERIEVVGTLDLGDNLWVGGSYRLNYGFSALLGIKFQSFSFAYAYDPSSNFVSGFDLGTHEVQIGLNIGERKKLARSKPILRTIQKTETHQARFSHDDVQTNESLKGGKVFYVVIKEFRDFNSADNFVRMVQEEQDLTTNIFYNKNNRVFYVYIYQTESSKEANKELKAVKELTKFKNVKIITIEN
ncbi:PorP/SprF family type IX secretion system membrane protein [Fulvivirga sp.]|uniref:PorP/SprF family type IX secretion system membrane protein n=1 Tax=Fulvivirga sp. TaxID=1931237 RepID=UPI0032EB304E